MISLVHFLPPPRHRDCALLQHTAANTHFVPRIAILSKKGGQVVLRTHFCTSSLQARMRALAHANRLQTGRQFFCEHTFVPAPRNCGCERSLMQMVWNKDGTFFWRTHFPSCELVYQFNPHALRRPLNPTIAGAFALIPALTGAAAHVPPVVREPPLRLVAT